MQKTQKKKTCEKFQNLFAKSTFKHFFDFLVLRQKRNFLKGAYNHHENGIYFILSTIK